MKYLDAWISQPEWMMHPMQQFARDSESVRYEELLAWNLVGSEFGVEYELFYIDADRDAYEAKLDEVNSVEWYDLTPIDEDSFYLYLCQDIRTEDTAWRQAFVALDLLLVPPVRYDGADFLVTVVGDGEDIRTMLSGLPEEIEVTVNAIGEYDRRHAPVVADLTDRQLEAVAVATECGFYEVPREATVEDVAAELDCASSTASNLLGKAESRIMHRLVDRRGIGRSNEE